MRLTPKETIVKMSSGGPHPLFIIHPIEGVVTELEYLASLLPYTVYGFQCTTDVPDDTIESITAHYIKIMKTIDIQDPVILVGYSFGASVAFEMALTLEAEGRTVHLFLIDGAPEFVRKQTSLYRARTTKDADESHAFPYYINIFKSIDLTEFQKLQKEFEALPGMESRLALCAKKLEGVGESEEDIKLAAATFYKKILAAESYFPAKNFKGKTVLMKADQNFVAFEKDYGLKKVCDQVSEIYTYKTDHKGIIKGQVAKKVANRIINAINS